MIHGVMIAESIRVGGRLDGIQLKIRSIFREAPGNTAKYQPDVWTFIEFEADDTESEQLADRLANVLDSPGWYADFRSECERWVVFPNRVFRYGRGDKEQRKHAEDYGRSLGIPESQLDWPD